MGRMSERFKYLSFLRVTSNNLSGSGLRSITNNLKNLTYLNFESNRFYGNNDSSAARREDIITLSRSKNLSFIYLWGYETTEDEAIENILKSEYLIGIDPEYARITYSNLMELLNKRRVTGMGLFKSSPTIIGYSVPENMGRKREANDEVTTNDPYYVDLDYFNYYHDFLCRYHLERMFTI